MPSSIIGKEANNMETYFVDFAKRNGIPISTVREISQTLGQKIAGFIPIIGNLGDDYETETITRTIGAVSMTVTRVLNERCPTDEIKVVVSDGRRSIISGNDIETVEGLRSALESEARHLGKIQGIKTSKPKNRIVRIFRRSLELRRKIQDNPSVEQAE